LFKVTINTNNINLMRKLTIVSIEKSRKRHTIVRAFCFIIFVRRVPLVEQELITHPEHLNSFPVFSGVRVTRTLVWCVCFVDRCLSFCTFSFGHYVVCSSSIYRFWLPLWYLQTLLSIEKSRKKHTIVSA
jgi:hypothetical protein